MKPIEQFRFLIFAAFLAVLAVFWPALILQAIAVVGPIGLFMPIFGTAPVDCRDCCSPKPTTASITVSGMANGTCTACTSFNGTFVSNNHTENGAPPVCNWDKNTVLFPSCNSSGFDDLGTNALAALLSGDTGIKAGQNYFDSGLALRNCQWGDPGGPSNYKDIGAAPFSCIASGPYSLSVVLNFSGADCDSTGSSATVAFS